MTSEFHIDPMMPHEAQIAIDWAGKEGWNPGLHDAACFYACNPTGMFVGKVNQQPVAVASSVIYDNDFAFFGLLIVDEKHRDCGYSMAITNKRLEYIGQRNAGLDGVVEMQHAYAKNGFHYAHRNMRYHIQGFKNETILKNKKIVDLTNLPLQTVFDYDCKHFPAPRPAFLSAWINQADCEAIGYVENNQLIGYGVLRKCWKGYKIGPLFADNQKVAEVIFTYFCHQGAGEEIYFDITELNPHAKDLVQHYNMDMVFETARMYLKDAPQLPFSHIYGLTTFELG